MAGIHAWRPIVVIHPNPTPMQMPLCRNVSGPLQAKPRYKLSDDTHTSRPSISGRRRS